MKEKATSPYAGEASGFALLGAASNTLLLLPCRFELLGPRLDVDAGFFLVDLGQTAIDLVAGFGRFCPVRTGFGLRFSVAAHHSAALQIFRVLGPALQLCMGRRGKNTEQAKRQNGLRGSHRVFSGMGGLVAVEAAAAVSMLSSENLSNGSAGISKRARKTSGQPIFG
jgi:hypothetical protein